MNSDHLQTLTIPLVTVILRVPSLFLLEFWFRTDYVFNSEDGSNNDTNQLEQIANRLALHGVLGFAAIIGLLPIRRLVNFYAFVISGALILVAKNFSWQYVLNRERFLNDPAAQSSDYRQEWDIMEQIAVQVIVSASVSALLSLKHRLSLLVACVMPVIICLCNVNIEVLHLTYHLSSGFLVLLSLAYIISNTPEYLEFLKISVARILIIRKHYGVASLLLTAWVNLLLPMQLFTFWNALFVVQLCVNYKSEEENVLTSESPLVIALAAAGEACQTPISLFALCITVAYVACFILYMTRIYLLGFGAAPPDNIMHNGWTEGFTMFLLALQTGLIDLESMQRVFLLSLVLFIVLSSLIQSIYEVTEPILLTMAASQSCNMFRHARAVVLCTFLWLFPLYMVFIICQIFNPDFWLLAVISSCLLTSVQVLGTLVVYSLLIYDAIREKSWDKLDDVVYYAKSITRVLEFIVAVFVVCYGIQETIVGEWSWVNSSILIVHCYFNVWQRLQSGWRSYLLRREASKRIESLPEATASQLKEHKDVCAICYQDMETACITTCQHYFHAVCLRKWLYIQDTCPMCFKKFGGETSQEENNSESPINEERENEEAVLPQNISTPQYGQQNAEDGRDLEARHNLEQQNIIYHQLDPSLNDLQPSTSTESSSPKLQSSNLNIKSDEHYTLQDCDSQIKSSDMRDISPSSNIFKDGELKMKLDPSAKQDNNQT